MYSIPLAAVIIDLEGGGIFKFQFKPDSLVDSDMAHFADYPILGRSAPIKGYQHGGPRTIEFTAVLFANPTADGPPMPPPLIKLQVDFLRSLVRPDYNGLKPPHKCLIIFGGNIQFIGVCTSAQASYPANAPWDLGPGFSHCVQVACKFEEVKDVPLDTWQVRVGAF